jgi:serine protease Do
MSDPTSESQRYEPQPVDRHHRMAELGGGQFPGQDASTPERWLPPFPEPPIQPGWSPAPPASRGISRRFAGVLFATSLIGAIAGSGGVYAALRASGAFNEATPSPRPANGTTVSVQSDESTVIAAVTLVGPAVVAVSTTYGSGASFVGAGVIYDRRGWILTNRHVVEGATSITIRISDGREATGKVYGLDSLTDLAVVKVDGLSGLTAAPIGSSASIQVGQLAIAIGDPLGLNYPNSVTTGIVSALGRDLVVMGTDTATSSTLHDLIQTDAAINAGNSGGPLIDASGRVVGIATAENQVGQGIGFAVPIDIAKPIMQQALAGEKLSRPFIGVSYLMIDQGVKQQYKLPLNDGAWVHTEDAAGNSIEAVVAGSPGSKAGIKTGDIVTEVEGQAITGNNPLQDVLVQFSPGRTVSLQVYRAGKYLTFMVFLGIRPDTAG